MRASATLLVAFFLSLLAGGTAATQIAIMTKAREEFIAVFFMLGLVAMLAAFAFAVAQWRGDKARRIAWTGRALLILLILISAALATLSLWDGGGFAGVRRDAAILLGVAVPSLAVVLVQWLIVSRRARAVAARP